MKTFQEWLNDQSLNESVKLKKDSIMFNGRPSSELNAAGYDYGSPYVYIFVNGGSSYNFDASKELVAAIRNLDFKEQQKYAAEIALKVANLIESEIGKLEKKLLK